VSGQAINPDFVHGRDYTFERIEAKRTVRDEQDKAVIRLVSYVYRPVKNDRREAVLFSHGSIGAGARSPKEQGDAPPRDVIRFFVMRGYTLVAPMRRGRGESTGTYVEECSVYIGQCTTAEYFQLGDRALREALLDTDAVINQVILGRLVPRDSKIIALGISRGGFLSLILAGERPKLVKGVVNFVGGWYGVSDRITAEENQQRVDDQKARLIRAVKLSGAPSIWLYGARDPFYKEGVPRELYGYWKDVGRQSEFVYIDNHSLSSGHLIATSAMLWEKQVDAFLKPIEQTKQ
jgi:dienelactone hydrolase